MRTRVGELADEQSMVIDVSDARPSSVFGAAGINKKSKRRRAHSLESSDLNRGRHQRIARSAAIPLVILVLVTNEAFDLNNDFGSIGRG